ncbi:MAG TPA: LTA synthase family protein, partial [Bacillota bacterium]|nr:LTA synthase family protein [Bacillota bacterium]
NRLLRHSLYFSNIKEQVGEGNSADAEFILFNSLYPLPQGIVSLRYPTNHYYSFPHELSDNGYTTAAFVGMEKAFMNMGVMLPKYGFKQIYPISSFQLKEKIGLGLADGEMFPQALERIRTLPKPFFAYLITLTNHVPYYLPTSMQNKELRKGISNQRVRDYLQTVHYVDHVFGDFLDKFHKLGLDKDTVLVIYGDHEGVNKYYSKDVDNSGLQWIKNNKIVPLIIYHPSLKGKEVKELGGQVDILPTVEHLLNIHQDYRMRYRVGRNLLLSQASFAITQNGEYLTKRQPNEELKSFRLLGPEMSLKVIQADLFVE